MDQGDSEAAAAFYRVDNLLTSLDDELADPRLRSRVEAFLDAVEEGPAGPGPPPRADFEALIG